MGRVVAGRGGLAQGRESRAFRLDELRGDLSSDHLQLYMETDGGGRVVVRDARGAAPPPAAVLRALPLAPDVHRRDVELCAAGGACRLRVLRDAPPGAPLEMWFDESLLAAIDMPFLTPRNIKGRDSYVCHECGVQFERPNPLKLHLFLACAPYSARHFWRRVLQQLTSPSPPPLAAPLNLSLPADPSDAAAARAAPAPHSAFRPYRHPAWLGAPPPPPPAWARPTVTAAEAEALATSWGKSKEGHLCLYCGKVYSRKYGLKIHIRTHTGYKPLQCKYCLRPFGDPSNLNKHVRLHAASGGGGGEECARAAAASAPYACPRARCGKLLVRRRDLERHLRSRHAPSASAATRHKTLLAGSPSP